MIMISVSFYYHIYYIAFSIASCYAFNVPLPCDNCSLTRVRWLSSSSSSLILHHRNISSINNNHHERGISNLNSNFYWKSSSNKKYPPYTSTTVIRATNNEDNTIDTSDNNNEKQRKISFQKDIQEKLTFPIQREYNNMGPLVPIAEKLDSITGDWALSYADLSPESPRTPAGVAFLATNACYACAGLALGVQGEWTLGLLTEIAGIVSFWYHYSQLEFGKDKSEVRLALLIDYFTAGSALLTGGFYMAQMGITSVPFDAVVVAIFSVISLSLCWVWEFGYPYLFWHSLWHISSAYCGYLIGQAHLTG